MFYFENPDSPLITSVCSAWHVPVSVTWYNMVLLCLLLYLCCLYAPPCRFVKLRLIWNRSVVQKRLGTADLVGACTWCKSDTYSSAWPCRALDVIMRTLNRMVKPTGSQCKDDMAGVMRVNFVHLVKSLAAASWTSWRPSIEALLRRVKRELQWPSRDETKARTIISNSESDATAQSLATFARWIKHVWVK